MREDNSLNSCPKDAVSEATRALSDASRFAAKIQREETRLNAMKKRKPRRRERSESQKRAAAARHQEARKKQLTSWHMHIDDWVRSRNLITSTHTAQEKNGKLHDNAQEKKDCKPDRSAHPYQWAVPQPKHANQRLLKLAWQQRGKQRKPKSA